MSYYIETVGGDFIGDLATTMGLRDLRERGNTPRLSRFIKKGEADVTDFLEIIKETEVFPDTRYIADMLRPVKFPVIITDGVH